MSIQEIASKLVQLCNEGKSDDAVRELYAGDIVSIEGAGSDQMPARIEGLEAVVAKGVWWSENHEVHNFSATGPFIGHRDDQFVVKFDLDVTPKGADRLQMSEVGIYTVKDGKIAQEEFLYQS
jgi:hypothetical protein